jgi:short-subunit dehydrogenase
MEDLKQSGAQVRKMDVTKEEEIKNVVDEILEKEGQIDALLANAGYGEYGTIEDIPMENIQHQYDVNVFGVLRSIKAVLPNMRERRTGRIVITASLASHTSGMGLGHYSGTKHALKAIGTALRQEVNGLGIHVSMIEPGFVKTGFANVMFNNFDINNFSPEYREKMKNFESYNKKEFENAPDMSSTIDAIVDAVTSENPKIIYKTTLQSKVLNFAEKILPVKFLDFISAKIMK